MRAVSHRALLLLFAGLLVTLPVGAAVAAGPGAAYPKPALCADQAAALGAATCARITQVLRNDEKASGDEIAVAVVPSTGGVPIETWGTGLFNAWGVGQRGKDDGVLLVIAVTDHHLRLVTGRGLAARLPDGAASEIVAGTIAPLLRKGQTRAAVLTGLDAVRAALGHDVTGGRALAGTVDPGRAQPTPPEVTLPSAQVPPEPDKSGGSRLAWLGLFCCLAAVAVGGYIRRMRRTRGARYVDVPNRQRPWWAQERRWWSGVLPGSASASALSAMSDSATWMQDGSPSGAASGSPTGAPFEPSSGSTHGSTGSFGGSSGGSSGGDFGGGSSGGGGASGDW